MPSMVETSEMLFIRTLSARLTASAWIRRKQKAIEIIVRTNEKNYICKENLENNQHQQFLS